MATVVLMQLSNDKGFTVEDLRTFGGMTETFPPDTNIKATTRFVTNDDDYRDRLVSLTIEHKLDETMSE